MPREYSRSQRISSQLQRELAAVVQSELKDPRLGFVTVSAVEVSRDLAVAKVFITILNADKESVKKNLTVLTHSISFIRRALGKRLRMRNIPELRFFYDDSIDRGMRLDELLNDENSAT